MKIETSGSVRVDLLGGTLDLNPINLILPNVVTLNLATSLKAKVKLAQIDFDGVEIISRDYNSTERFKSSEFTRSNLNNGHFGKLTFMCQILDLFEVHRGLSIELESGSPPGAGLGGSSAMGVTFFSALAQYKKIPLDRIKAIRQVNSIEARILDSGPAGYQDYYPALFGGVLALLPEIGDIKVEQLFDHSLKSYLENHLTLVYSGDTRLSGINNWEVYKSFFNKEKHVRDGLGKIADLSYEAYVKIKNKKLDGVVDLIAQEGAERKKLFPGIVTSSMSTLMGELQAHGNFGMKVCGAGGGGCFLITHLENEKELVEQLVRKHHMTKLEFKIEEPLA